MIHIVLGTKAQLIKMAPVMVRLADKGLRYNFIYTGQHRATMDEMLVEFGLRQPDVILYRGPDIVSPPRMFLWFVRVLWHCILYRKRIFGNDRHGVVLVHGDTFSTLLGALMGRMAGLRVGHVESGLRSFNIFHPFPEELVRLLTFRLSHILYCPGQWAADNVKRLRRRVVDTRSNTMADALAMTLKKERRRDHVPARKYAIVSLHRYENIFNRDIFSRVIDQLIRVAGKHHLLFILHPPTAKQLRKYGFCERLDRHENIELRPRYSYFDFVSLIEGAEFVITDGGSIQEESSYLGVPCLLLRKATERREGLGGNVVLSEYRQSVMDEFVSGYEKYRQEPRPPDASPSGIIVESVREFA
jgi:UDP-N-acetylglucosamine 2-epimerase (non-hydrolysing)